MRSKKRVIFQHVLRSSLTTHIIYFSFHYEKYINASKESEVDVVNEILLFLLSFWALRSESNWNPLTAIKMNETVWAERCESTTFQMNTIKSGSEWWTQTDQWSETNRSCVRWIEMWVIQMHDWRLHSWLYSYLIERTGL